MTASQHYFNKGVFNVLKSYNRISLETYLYHLNSKSKQNFLNIEVYGGFFIKFYFFIKLNVNNVIVDLWHKKEKK